MRLSRKVRRESGFTLIELVISAAIAAIILGASYACLRAGLTTRTMVESRSDLLQSARVALAMMSADLRAATPLSSDFEFLGMHRTLGEMEADNLDFATHNYTPHREHEGDFCEVSYFVDQNPESGQFSLWRRRDPTPDPEPLTGGSREEIVRGVRGLTIEYYDGFEWFTDWGDPSGKAATQNATLIDSNLQGLPEAVRIRLTLETSAPSRAREGEANKTDESKEGEPPFVIETIARLNLAPMANSSIGGDTASTQSGATSQPGVQPGATPNN